MKIEPLSYSDGHTNFIGYLADPQAGGKRPGVLIVHEAPGLNDHPKLRARMIAELGYVGFAADMYGNGKIAEGEETQALMGGLRNDIPRLRRTARAAFDTLAKLPQVDASRIGVMGYCFGGLVVLELARSGAPISGLVSFHGILSTKTPEDATNVKGKVLVCTGAADPLVPPEQLAAFEKEMNEGKVDWQVQVYGGAKHAFTNRDADKAGRPQLGYQEKADRRSWQAMRDFWTETFA
jgi:dienelactone hydrolase